MKLQVSLIPALAYALMMMLSDMVGINVAVVKPSKSVQSVSQPATCQEFNQKDNYVFVAKNGQVTLSSGFGKGNLEWMIPYTHETKQAIKNSCYGFALRTLVTIGSNRNF